MHCLLRVFRLNVRENGRQKICVGGLLENKIHDAKSLVQVAVFQPRLAAQYMHHVTKYIVLRLQINRTTVHYSVLVG